MQAYTLLQMTPETSDVLTAILKGRLTGYQLIYIDIANG